jgi:hypothetical protein
MKNKLIKFLLPLTRQYIAAARQARVDAGLTTAFMPQDGLIDLHDLIKQADELGYKAGLSYLTPEETRWARQCLQHDTRSAQYKYIAQYLRRFGAK